MNIKMLKKTIKNNGDKTISIKKKNKSVKSKLTKNIIIDDEFDKIIDENNNIELNKDIIIEKKKINKSKNIKQSNKELEKTKNKIELCKNKIINDDDFIKINEDVIKKDTNKKDTNEIDSKKNNIFHEDKHIIYNKGEIGEIVTINKLYDLKNDCKKLIHIFGDDILEGYELYDMDGNIILNKEQIKKSKSKSKADCIMELKKTKVKYFISIKCTNGSLPSILNHTPRSAKVFCETGELFNNLEKLDKLIKLLNEERKKGNVGEDIVISNNLINIDNDLQENLLDVLKYFMFYGSGSGISKNPVNSILEISEPNDITKWNFINCDDDIKKIEYIKKIYNKIVISMRDKGMPKNKNKLEICNPWIYNDKNNKKKGSLHIRIKK